MREAVFYVQYTLENNWKIEFLCLLICKDNVVAEYSLEEVSQPIGIAGYELSNALSKEYQRSLPTIEMLESEVAKMMDTK